MCYLPINEAITVKPVRMQALRLKFTYYIFFICFISICIISCKSDNNKPEVLTEKKMDNSNSDQERIYYCHVLPQIDGKIDAQWENVEWKLGEKPSEKDFKGEYKVMWNESGLAVLAKITDDKLVDTHKNPLVKYWDDDCLEIFVDEDASGGNHQYSHNAFAYHISLDQKIADIGPDQKPHLYPSNVHSVMKDLGNNQYLWEVQLNMFDDSFIDGQRNEPIRLKANQNFGFAIAYCDNDNSEERENFIGSVEVKGKDKNRGWIDAGIFGRYTLTKQSQ